LHALPNYNYCTPITIESQEFLGCNLSASEDYPLSDTSKGAKATYNTESPKNHWGIRLINYVKRKLEQRKAKKQYEQPADRAARRTAWATIWIAGFTLVLAVVSYLQWQELKGSDKQTDRLLCLYQQQLAQLTKQAGDTHDLAVAAKTQAAQTINLATETHNLAVNASNQVAIIQGQLDLARQQLRVEHRSWITIQHNGNLLDDFSTQIKIVNKGKSIARNIVIDQCSGLFEMNSPPDFKYDAPCHSVYIPAMYQDDFRDQTLKPHTPVSDLQRLSFAEGVEYFAFYARIRYGDEFGPHWTHVCWWTASPKMTDSPNIMSCVNYNDADSDSTEKLTQKPN
jgi:hypothetical protein